MQPARVLVAEFYGVEFRTDANETDVAVGVAVVEAIAFNGRRLKLELSNTGATDITIRRDIAVTAPTGFLIPSKGSYIIDWTTDYAEVCKALFAISSAAAGTLHIREIVSVEGTPPAGM